MIRLLGEWMARGPEIFQGEQTGIEETHRAVEQRERLDRQSKKTSKEGRQGSV